MELDNASRQCNLLVTYELNGKPRKVYGFKTPNNLFSKYIHEKNVHLVVESAECSSHFDYCLFWINTVILCTYFNTQCVL
jgi:hypothetical protein